MSDFQFLVGVVCLFVCTLTLVLYAIAIIARLTQIILLLRWIGRDDPASREPPLEHYEFE